MARKIATLLLIFITFYMGAHYWIRWRNSVTGDVTKISRLVDCDPNQVRLIKITQRRATDEVALSFSRTDKPRSGLSSSAQVSFSEWDFLSPLTGEADASVMVRFASMFCDTYDPIPTSEDQFIPGSSPVEKIEFSLEGGKNSGLHTLIFGGISNDRMSVVKYVPPSGDQRTVKIPPKIMQQASLEPVSFLNMKVVRMSADNVIRAAVFFKAKEQFVLEREGDGWNVIAEGRPPVAGSGEAAKYVNRLTTLRALKVDKEALSPSACEANSSQVRVELFGVGDRRETLFFQYGKRGPVSACNSARETLFTVHRDLIQYIEQPISALVLKP